MAKKALIAMSGGVDSSVAAYLMKEAGYDCIGVTMKLYDNEDIGMEREKTCCSLSDIEDARSVCVKLGIPYYVFNFKDDFKEKVLDSTLPVLIDFYSDSCVPCKRMTPVIGDIEDDNEGKLAVYKVNINFDADIAEQYEVQSVPTLVLFNKGNEVARQTGAVRKDALSQWLEENLSK